MDNDVDEEVEEVEGGGESGERNSSVRRTRNLREFEGRMERELMSMRP